MNKSTPEYIRVREEIAKKLYADDGNVVEWYWDKSEQREIYLVRADSILSIKGIAILADDQKPPRNDENDIWNTSPKRVCDDTQKEMLKYNFKKVV